MKLAVYEGLFQLNEAFDQVLNAMRRMEKFGSVRKEFLRYARLEIEEVRAGTNADFVEVISERERDDEGRFYEQRRAYQKKLEDPDDVYVNVERREEERRKRGLPPRVGIIPRSVVAAEEDRVEAESEQRKDAPRKAGTETRLGRKTRR